MSSYSKNLILILHSDVEKNALADELDTLLQVEQVHEGLTSLGYSVESMPFDKNFPDNIERMINDHQIKIIFNLVESVDGRNDALCFIPKLIEKYDLVYTGANFNALFSTTHKICAKRYLNLFHILTPQWFSWDEIHKNKKRINEKYIVKSVLEDGSLGIDNESIADNSESLMKIMMNRRQRFGGEWFAEQFISGREFNASLIEDKNTGLPRVLPLAEIKFIDYEKDEFHIIDYAAKWDTESKFYYQTPLHFDFDETDKTLLEKINHLAIQCWDCFELSGYARVDFRVDENGNPWVLEVNANPCLNKDAGFVAACARDGMSYEQMLDNIIACAINGSKRNFHNKKSAIKNHECLSNI